MQKNKVCGIYCIENITTNKRYIGQSINAFDRWRKHKRELKNNTHDNDYLQNAWNKYGINDFKFYILEECDISELDDKEVYYINLYNTLDRNCGYNLKQGGQNGGSFVLDYVKEKMSKAIKKSYEEHPEYIENRKNDALKQWANPEIKKKISGENNGMYGKTHTKEAREKISKAAKGRISPFRNTTPVLCIELNKIFDCAEIAKKELNINTSILEVCKGNRKTAGGYHWQFVNLENKIC